MKLATILEAIRLGLFWVVSEIRSLPDLLSEQFDIGDLETEDDNNLPSVVSHDDLPLEQTPDQQFDIKHLKAVVKEARMQNGVRCNLKLPWESGVMSDIFGTSSLRLLPKVEAPIGYIDLPVGRDVASSSKVPVETSTKTVFENCVKFSMNRTKLDHQRNLYQPTQQQNHCYANKEKYYHHSEEAQWDIVTQRWESIIMQADMFWASWNRGKGLLPLDVFSKGKVLRGFVRELMSSRSSQNGTMAALVLGADS